MNHLIVERAILQEAFMDDLKRATKSFIGTERDKRSRRRHPRKTVVQAVKDHVVKPTKNTHVAKKVVKTVKKAEKTVSNALAKVEKAKKTYHAVKDAADPRMAAGILGATGVTAAGIVGLKKLKKHLTPIPKPTWRDHIHNYRGLIAAGAIGATGLTGAYALRKRRQRREEERNKAYEAVFAQQVNLKEGLISAGYRGIKGAARLGYRGVTYPVRKLLKRKSKPAEPTLNELRKQALATGKAYAMKELERARVFSNKHYDKAHEAIKGGIANLKSKYGK